MACGAMSGSNLDQRRGLGAADRHGMRTARVKVAAGWRRDRRRDFAADAAVQAPSGLDPRDFPQEGLRVRMIGARKQLLGPRLLDEATEIHDQDAVAQML